MTRLTASSMKQTTYLLDRSSMATLKTCFKCGLKKQRSEFYRHPQMGDGLLGKCKACTRLDVRTNRAARAEYYKAFDRSRAMAEHRVIARKHYAATPAGKIAIRRAHVNYEMRFPERKHAVTTARNAVRDGRLLPHPCWVCGSKAQAHHPDYSAPLDVVWLCRKHHKEAHDLVRETA
jgi:hypothetical protein